MKPAQWDGHCHSQYCPHGSGDPTELRVQQAIKLGFTHLSITEHAPLPEGIVADKALFDELALTLEQLPEYLSHVQELKARYQGQIELKVGLEVDFVPGYEDYLREFFQTWGPQLDDSLLSVHFIDSPKGPVMIDYSVEHFANEVIPLFGNLKAVHQAYWGTILKSVELDFGHRGPNRLGHLGLIHKFAQIFPPPEVGPNFFVPLVQKIKKKGYTLDFNVAGFGRPTCGQAYLPPGLLALAREAKIPLVYGSDAHSIKAIGQQYPLFTDQTHV